MRRRPNPASGHAVRQRSVPSVVLLLKVQLEGHAFRQFLEQFLELRAGGGGDLDGHLRHLRGRGGAPPLHLFEPGGRGWGGGWERGGGVWGGGWSLGWGARRRAASQTRRRGGDP